MGFDDLFSDDEPVDMDVNIDKWGAEAMQRQNARIDAIISRNHGVIEAADDHLQQAAHIRQTVFGDDETYDQFISGVEQKLESDTSFQEKYQKLSTVHHEVVERTRLDNAPYQAPQRKAVPSAPTFIPGQPISQPVEAVTKRRNHIMRKDMV